jgi:hypothetical protein
MSEYAGKQRVNHGNMAIKYFYYYQEKIFTFFSNEPF